MRFLLAATAALFCSAAYAEDAKFTVTPAFTVKPEAAKPDVAGDVSKSVVYISVDLGGGSSGGGTGTVIASEGGSSLIATNAHVVESADHPITVTYWHDGKPYSSKATYVAGSTVSHLGFSGGAYQIKVNGPDLAFIVLPFTLPAVEIADIAPQVGEEVHLYGFGGAGVSGTVPLHKTGAVSGDPGWIEPAMKTTIRTVNGDSGAAVLNCKNQLVGVHWGGASVPLATFTTYTASVTKSERVLFPRLHDRMAARQAIKGAIAADYAAKAKAAAAKAKEAPKAAPSEPKAIPFSVTPAGSNCPGGVCQPTVSRGLFRRR